MTHGDASWIGKWLCSGRFEVREELGGGGMARVYRAWDHHLDKDVVVKVPLREVVADRDAVRRFLLEVRALVTLSHPHIVPIIDVGEEADLPFAVMKYLSQGSLETRRPKRGGEGPAGVPVAEVAGWLVDVAEALDFIHGKGYVHRDVKPGNILFDGEGHVYLADFGVAKALLAEPLAQGVSLLHTQTGFVLGTPEYMAPEIIMGQRYDGRADQYSLAATVYDVLAGRPPFEAQPPSALLVHHVATPPRKLSEFLPGIGEEVADVVDKALAKEPEDRFPDCRSFGRALVDAAGLHAVAEETRSRYGQAGATNRGEPLWESRQPGGPFEADPDTASRGPWTGTAGPSQRGHVLGEAREGAQDKRQSSASSLQPTGASARIRAFAVLSQYVKRSVKLVWRKGLATLRMVRFWRQDLPDAHGDVDSGAPPEPVPASFINRLFRRSIIAIAHVVLLLLLSAAILSLRFAQPKDEDISGILALHFMAFWGATLLLVIPATLFLSASPWFRRRDPDRRRPIWRSVICGGLLASYVVLGITSTILSEHVSENPDLRFSTPGLVILLLITTYCGATWLLGISATLFLLATPWFGRRDPDHRPPIWRSVIIGGLFASSVALGVGFTFRGGMIERATVSPHELTLWGVIVILLTNSWEVTWLLVISATLFLSASPWFGRPDSERRRPIWRSVMRSGLLASFVFMGIRLTIGAGMIERATVSPDGLTLRDVFVILLTDYWDVKWLLVIPPTLFLLAFPWFARPDRQRRRPIWRSVICGGLLAGFVALGIGLAIGGGMIEFATGPRDQADEATVWGLSILLLLTTWALWVVVFGFLWAGRWAHKFQRMYATLLAGTILELMITIPIDAAVRRKSSCYCQAPTLFGMAVGLAVGIWTFGPGVLLLICTRYDQRVNRGWFCRHCGQDMRPYKDVPQCVSCGQPFMTPRMK